MAARLYITEWRIYHGVRTEGRRLSQERLGERVGRSGATISRLERGRTDYSGKLLAALAEALGCEEPDLFRRPPNDDAELEFRRRIERMTPPDRRRAERILAALEDEAPAA
ncbi:MAG: helix-turn-helix transcriptional regulator [Proteobacteria bacterium]|nr:helix-turn-helix transcriptional regulator [Pseudomonadota bacterium]